MTYIFPQLYYVLGLAVFLSITSAHLFKKSSACVICLIVQSVAVFLLIFIPAIQTSNSLLIIAALLTLAIKAIAAPFFFFKLIRRHELTFSANNYLSLPLTLITVAILSGLAYSDIFRPLALLSGDNMLAIPLALAAIFISIFLTINRRGALSQIIGILSLENSIVALVAFLGVEQLPGLDIGVSFDLAVWIVIATLFLSLIYKQFGTLDVNAMKNLKEE